MRYLLVGNFGVGNLGDEALKEYFLRRFPDIEWKVISAHPKAPTEVYRLPSGIRSLLSFRWIATLQEYKQCDGVVFGGGSLFTDTESSFACFLWWLHALPAYFFHKPIHLAFQGIGPFNTRLGSWFSYAVCRVATTISVRDSLSYIRLEKRGLGKKCIQSCDPIYSQFKAKKLDVSSKNVLVLIPRKNSSSKFSIAAQNAIKSNAWSTIRVISMQTDNKSEIEYCQSLIDTAGKNAILVKVTSVDELLHNMSDSGLVISERYHGALAALAIGKHVEIIAQSSGDKLSSLEIDAQQDWDDCLQKGEKLLVKYVGYEY